MYLVHFFATRLMESLPTVLQRFPLLVVSILGKICESATDTLACLCAYRKIRVRVGAGQWYRPSTQCLLCHIETHCFEHGTCPVLEVLCGLPVPPSFFY